MKRKFIHTKDGHNKWWQIEVKGKKHFISWGRLGSEGQESEKEFSSIALAKSEAEKIIASKMKKGYEEDLPTTKKKYATDTSLEGGINNLLIDFSKKYKVSIDYIEDCDFRDEPRSMEFRKFSDDVDMKPLCDLALAIDALILRTPRHVGLESSSPYVRGCTQWYKERWDPMFEHDAPTASYLISTLESLGPRELERHGYPLIDARPAGKAVILKDRVLTDPAEIEDRSIHASIGEIWIVSNGEEHSTERFVKVSEDSWCMLK